jgi:hypothetical protein
MSGWMITIYAPSVQRVLKIGFGARKLRIIDRLLKDNMI